MNINIYHYIYLFIFYINQAYSRYYFFLVGNGVIFGQLKNTFWVLNMNYNFRESVKPFVSFSDKNKL